MARRKNTLLNQYIDAMLAGDKAKAASILEAIRTFKLRS